jgi:hypothetical protein
MGGGAELPLEGAIVAVAVADSRVGSNSEGSVIGGWATEYWLYFTEEFRAWWEELAEKERRINTIFRKRMAVPIV